MDFVFLGAIAAMAIVTFGLIALCDRLRTHGEPGGRK